MFTKPKCTLILLLFLVCINFVRAQTINLDQADPALFLGRAVSYFKDTASGSTFSEVQQLFKEGKFIKGNADILNFGNTPAATWVRFSVTQPANASNFLVVGYANIERVDCYIGCGGKWRHFQAGSLTPGSAGIRSGSQYIFPIDIPKGEQGAEVWLRVKSRNIILLPLQLAKADNLYLIENAGNRVIELCFIGFLSALLIFHILLYFTVKDPAYLYYCLYILSLGIYTIGYLSGHLYLLGDSLRTFIYRYPHIFFAVGFATSILITNRFYNIRSISMPLFRWTNLLLVSLMGLFFLSLTGFKAQAALASQVFGLVVPLTLVVTGIYAYRVERRTITFLSAAWLTFVIAVIYYVLSLQGILPYQHYSPLILQGGVLLEFMLLAMALGRRYQTILEKQRQVEEENLRLVQVHNSELEQQVAMRTQTLNDVIDKLKASDEIKNRLFSIIAHDLRTPFNSLLSILSTEVIDLLSEDELRMILRSNGNHFQQLKIMLDNILHWARSQMQEVNIKNELFDIKELTRFLVTVYKPIAEQKKVEIQIISSRESGLCRADKNHIRLVLRNLLDNAVKYTNATTDILIEISRVGDAVRFSISNSFTAMPGINIDERGLGLGINLCEDYLRRNGSSLHREIAGEQIRFSFLLPAADLPARRDG